MEIIFILLIFLLLIGISLNDVTGNRKWSSLLDRKGIILLIVFWSIAGFALRIHFSTFPFLFNGPEAAYEHYWTIKNIAMAGIPIAIYISSFLIKIKENYLTLYGIEIGLWLYILLFAKGNYTWGFYPESFYLLYDYIALFLRFMLFLHVFEAQEHKFSLAWLLAHVMVSCKIDYFSNSCF